MHSVVLLDVPKNRMATKNCAWMRPYAVIRVFVELRNFWDELMQLNEPMVNKFSLCVPLRPAKEAHICIPRLA